MDVGEVSAKLSMDATGFHAEVNKSVEKLEALKATIRGMGDELRKSGRGDAEINKVATAMQNLGKGANETAVATKQTASGISAMATAARELGFALSTVALVGYLKNIFTTASHMQDLSQRTEIAISSLVKLKPILETNGSSIEMFANSVFRARVQIGQIRETTDPAYKAIKDLGISFNAIADASPIESVRMLFTAIKNMEDPIKRDAAAFTFFGGTFRQIKPALEEMITSMGKTDTVIDEQMKKVAEYQNAWVKAMDFIVVRVSVGMGMVIKGLERAGSFLADVWRKSGIGDVIARSGLNAFGAGMGGGQSSILSPTDWAKGGINIGEIDFGPKKPPPDRESQLINPEAVARAKAAKQAIDNFIDGLEKQAKAQEESSIEIDKGSAAAREFAINTQIASFRTELFRETQHRLTSEQEGKIRKLANEYLQMADAVDTAKAKQDALKESMELIDKTTVETLKNATDFAEVLRDIKFTAMSDGEKAAATVNKEFDKLYVTLLKVQDALIETGRMTPEVEDQITKGLNTIRMERAIAQVRARVALTEEGEDPEAAGKARAEKFGESIANSFTNGIRNTLMGVETGQQTLGEASKNLVRNMVLELQFAIFDETIMGPIKSFAQGFVTGLVGSISDAFEKDMKRLGEDLGKSLKNMLANLDLGGMFGGLFNFGGGSAGVGMMSALDMELGWAPGMRYGGPIPSFARGGLFRGHPGEYVVNAAATQKLGAANLAHANATGQWPSANKGTAVNVEINGDITPRQPNMTPDQVVRVTAGNITNDGMVMSAIEQRLRLRGK